MLPTRAATRPQEAGFTNLIGDRDRPQPMTNQGRTKRARIADSALIKIRSHLHVEEDMKTPDPATTDATRP